MPVVDAGWRLQSLYVPLGDGVRLAVDVWLPTGLIAAGHRLGTILRATRYHRAEVPERPGLAADSNYADGELWNGAGFAHVIVDARGSGASFGTRTTELSEPEISDYGEVIDWIAAQPWSNGLVGAYGYSYDGDTAEMMARLGNPHLVAVAPLFSDFDPYRQLIYPGGCYAERAFGRWLDATRVLDGVTGAAARLAARTGLPEDAVTGMFRAVKPVDGPDGPGLLAEAVAEHQANADLTVLIEAAEYRDSREDGVDWDTPAVPRWQREIEASGVPMFLRAGWLDAGTVAGTLTRFATFSNPQEVEIGPWNHAGATICDPLLPAGEAAPDWAAMTRQNGSLVEFFARHVRRGEQPGDATGGRRRTLRYSTLGTGALATTSSWPPAGLVTGRWYLAAPGQLSPAAGPATIVRHIIDPAASTGEANRWAGNVGGQPVGYPDRREAGKPLLTLTTGPLPGDVHVLGFPVLTLRLATSGTDGAVYAYLEDVTPDGDVRYVTEGELRLLHRATADPGGRTGTAGTADTAGHTGLGVPRGFSRDSAAPVRPGEAMDLMVEMFPVSALIRAGHRIRVAVAGHDAACFRRYGSEDPDGETFTVELGERSHLDLPVLPAT